MLILFGFFRMNKLLNYSNMAFLTNYMFVIDMCSCSCILAYNTNSRTVFSARNVSFYSKYQFSVFLYDCWLPCWVLIVIQVTLEVVDEDFKLSEYFFTFFMQHENFYDFFNPTTFFLFNYLIWYKFSTGFLNIVSKCFLERNIVRAFTSVLLALTVSDALRHLRALSI